jgi:hypothetical protein
MAIPACFLLFPTVLLMLLHTWQFSSVRTSTFSNFKMSTYVTETSLVSEHMCSYCISKCWSQPVNKH